MKKKKELHVLITGGAGFIGSNLCHLLLKKGYKLSIIDNLSSGFLDNLNSVQEKLTFFEKNIEDFDFSNLENVEAVVHLAAQPSVPLSISQFGKSSTSNLIGAIRVIEYCRKRKIPFVYASSSAVYGNLEMGNDTSSQVELLSPYAVDKHTMEVYSKLANQLYGVSSIGLRFFNVYGPRQDPNNPYSGVISIFSEKIINREPIIINGGHQSRDFVFVGDVVNLIEKSITLSLRTKVCKVSNVLTGTSVTIDELANELIRLIGNDVDKKYQSLQEGDPLFSKGSTKKMCDFFGVELDRFTSLENGLQKTVRFQRFRNL
ncbi:MAG: hypothetical protein CBC25_04240 [Pelagibacteraceae bacterium TMED65]|nr:MAG: hypothetical protein CBC25_04240 [Pelagibacteraceae bacterium TMED65]|tara:strand:- start:1822 stop:2772 length:951 start_codon:yes stop_codon:yes gene_type:complete